jgi:hypothetical protein
MSCCPAPRVPASSWWPPTNAKPPSAIGRRPGWWSSTRDLEGRVQVYADALTVPARGSSFQVLPAVPKRLEGLDYTLAIVDEAGRVDQEVYEVVALATGKQQSSVVLAIGTPGPELENTVLVAGLPAGRPVPG